MGKAQTTVIDAAQAEYHKVLIEDPLAFCDIACMGYKPNRGQERILRADLRNGRTLIVGIRRGGKTYGMARKIAWDLFRFPGCKIYIFAPSETQSSILMDDVCLLYRTSPYLSHYVKSTEKGNALYVHKEPNQSRLMLLKVGPDASKVRGHGTGTGGYIVADEIGLGFYNPRQITDVIEPFILESCGKGGLVYMSSASDAIPGDFFYDRYCEYTQQEVLAKEQGRPSKYHVFRIASDDCDHIDREEVELQRQRAIKEGRLSWFEREYEAKFTVPSGQYFSDAHVKACANPIPPIDHGDRLSVYIYAFDPGSRGSPAALQIARYNQRLNRLEVVHVASFIHEDKYKADTGDEKITEYADITEAVMKLRERFPIHTCYVDPNCERALTQSWMNQWGVNVIDVCVGGYNQKVKLLGDLERALQEQRIVWQDRRITEEMLRFAPPKNITTGRYEWDKTGRHDQIVCLGMLTKFLGDREVMPFAVVTAKRQRETQLIW